MFSYILFYGQVGRVTGNRVTLKMCATCYVFHVFRNSFFLTEYHTHSSVTVSLVWFWLGPADPHAHP